MKKRPVLTILLSIAIAEGVGFLSGLLAGDIRTVYYQLNRPPLSPPGWVFPVVWGILYALMGIAAGLIWLNRGDERSREQALIYYSVQLAVNFSWSIVFFRFQSFWLAVMIILILDVLVWITRRHFDRLSPAAGWLLVPYLAWLLFATYLAIGVFVLN
ncbi:MAG: tryptophan-rich sensory protein [Clostridia bacterium]|nr:tryptophan-rich sensory protein [Clostridia bacterium]